MRIRRVPKNIQNKVIKWFDYLWLTQNSSDEERAIQCLPGKIDSVKLSIRFYQIKVNRLIYINRTISLPTNLSQISYSRIFEFLQLCFSIALLLDFPTYSRQSIVIVIALCRRYWQPMRFTGL